MPVSTVARYEKESGIDSQKRFAVLNHCAGANIIQ